MRFAQLRGLRMGWVGAINYAVAAVCCGILWASQTNPPMGWPVVVFGVLAGVSFVALYFLMAAALKVVGAGIMQCATRLSVVIPIVVSVLFYDRCPVAMTQAAGVALALASFPLLIQAKPLPQPARSRWKKPVLILLFASNGAVGVIWKAYGRYVPSDGSFAILTVVFGVAFLGLLAAAVRDGPRATGDECLHGVALGLVNVCSCSAAVTAIAHLKGVVFFPTNAAGMILLTALPAALIWKERFNKRSLAGMALAGAAIALVHWK